MKTCRVCQQSKPLEDFHNRSTSKDGKQNKCKSCNINNVKAWQAANPERYEANWRRNQFGDFNKLKRKATKYGITVEKLQELIDDSNGVCNICKQPPLRWLVVDHCHNTIKVRGILCESCNQGLGLFKDNVGVLQNAIKYLQA